MCSFIGSSARKNCLGEHRLSSLLRSQHLPHWHTDLNLLKEGINFLELQCASIYRWSTPTKPREGKWPAGVTCMPGGGRTRFPWTTTQRWVPKMCHLISDRPPPPAPEFLYPGSLQDLHSAYTPCLQQPWGPITPECTLLGGNYSCLICFVLATSCDKYLRMSMEKENEFKCILWKEAGSKW